MLELANHFAKVVIEYFNDKSTEDGHDVDADEFLVTGKPYINNEAEYKKGDDESSHAFIVRVVKAELTKMAETCKRVHTKRRQHIDLFVSVYSYLADLATSMPVHTGSLTEFRLANKTSDYEDWLRRILEDYSAVEEQLVNIATDLWMLNHQNAERPVLFQRTTRTLSPTAVYRGVGWMSGYTGLSTLGSHIRTQLLIELKLTSLTLTEEKQVRKAAETHVDKHFKQFFATLRREAALDFSKQEGASTEAQDDKWDSYWDKFFGEAKESYLTPTY